MPGNEIGDRVHNFFSQENLSEERNWPGLSNNLWLGSETQIGDPPNSALKNHNHEQSDSERAPGRQSSGLHHGLNFGQSSLSHEFPRSHSQKLPFSNGYMQDHQVFRTRQDEANFLGMATESNRHNLTPKTQLGNGPQLADYVRLEHSESPVNYDFFGGQHQMRGQHANLLPRQQSGISDMQLLEQQVLITQTHELQRQQLQQHEARQLSSVNQMASVSKQAAGDHSMAQINGFSFHQVSNNSWQPDMMIENSSWLQHGAPTAMQASSSGLMVSSDQGQILHNRGLVPQQLYQSLHGVPISSTRGTQNQYSHMQFSKTSMQHLSASSNSLQGNHFAAFPDQVSMQDGQFVSTQVSQGRNMFGPSGAQNLSSGYHLESTQQLNQRQIGAPVHQAYVREDLPCSSGILQEKSMTQVGPSQTVATLDPTEEKILFGSDDNLWDAFSKGTGASNVLDDTDISSSFLSSGTWSALMQSAVAEASSADIRPQEEWNSWNSQHPIGNQQPSAIDDSSKEQLVQTDKTLHTAHTYGSRSVPFSDDAKFSINYGRYLESQETRFMPLPKQNDQQQIDSSQKISQQFSEGSKRFQNTLTEVSHTSGNVAKSSDTELNEKSTSMSWSHQRHNGSNGWNFMESKTPSARVSSLKNHENENPLQPSQTIDYKRAMHAEMAHRNNMWDTNSLPTSTIRIGDIKAPMGSSVVNREYSNLNNLSTVSNQERITNNSSLDFWKQVNSSVNSIGSGVSGQPQHHLEDGPKNLLPAHNVSAKRSGELDNYNKNENTSESFYNSVSPDISAGCLQENVWLDASDARTGGKQRSSGNVVKRPNINRFQYHPMGNVEDDPEPSYDTHNDTKLQTMPQQASRGYMAKFGGHLDRNDLEMDKGPTKSLDEVPSNSMVPGHGPNPSAPLDRSVSNYGPEAAPSGQNMLELIHKVDQSRDSGAGTHHSSSGQNLSVDMPEAETSDGSFSHLQRNPSPAYQSFGLQLAPPSQRMPVLDRNSCSQSTSQRVNSLDLKKPTYGKGDKGSIWLGPQATAHPSSSRETHLEESRNNVFSASEEPSNRASQSSLGSFPGSVSGFPYSRGHLQKNMFGTGGQVTRSRSVMPSDRLASHSKQMEDSRRGAQSSRSALVLRPGMSGTTPYNDHVFSAETSQLNQSNQNHARDCAQHISELDGVPVANSSVPTGMLQQAMFPKQLPSLRTSVSYVLGEQPNKGHCNVQSNSNTETTSIGQKKPECKMPYKGNDLYEFTAGSSNSQGIVGEMKNSKESMWHKESHGDSLAKQELSGCPDITFPNDVDTQRDIETFGRSLELNKNLHQSYSLLHQVQVMKNTEIDTCNKSVKRFEGPDCGPDARPVFSGGQQMSQGRGPFIQSGDSHSQKTSASPQDMFKFAPGDYQTRKLASSVVGDRSHISPQMAPSWFGQSEAFENADMLQRHDTRNSGALQTVEHPNIAGRDSGDTNDHNFMVQISSSKVNQLCDAQKNLVPTTSGDHFSSPQLLHPDVTERDLVLKPKKRKTTASEILSWHKELTQGSRRLENISTAETEWAWAANRLVEKMKDEVEMIEDEPPKQRAKRRLILTTQLTQQLFQPPPAAVLSLSARSQYENVAYFVSRLGLGNACSSVSCSRSDPPVPSDRENIQLEKCKASEKIGDHFLKVTEDFIKRGKKLENEFLRLEKSGTILDLRLESQDLEKFSVINRFAKFHGRPQTDGAENSSSEARSQPQRYVTAFPMPWNLPDRVHCLQL